MLPFYLILTCVLSATYARAVEHPSSTRRHFRSAGKSVIGVSVNRLYSQLKPHHSVVVKCKVKMNTQETMDILDIHFGMQLGHRTVLPLSNGFPGISISPASARSSSSGSHQKVVKHIKLSAPMYRFLLYGKNLFFCRAKSHSLNGRTDHGTAYFTVYKT